jgi:hypothetical protein
MRRLLILTAAALAMVAGMLFAWPVGYTYVGINTPSPTAHGATVARPFSVFGWCWNATRAIDYYEIWLIEDTNTDSAISQAEYDARVVVRRQEDFNVPDKTDQRLTSRYEVSAEELTPGNQYFLFIYAVDIDGVPTCDTGIVGAEPDGTGITVASPNVDADEVISYFRVEGVRP